MNYAQLRSELIADEGIRLKPYLDTTDHLTIGVGRNLDGNPLSADELAFIGHDCRSKPITVRHAIVLLENDIDKTVAAITRALPWFVKLDDVRQRVLVNMAFNMGLTTLLTFKNTLRFIDQGAYKQAAFNMLASRWATQVGKRAQRLARMMETGQV